MTSNKFFAIFGKLSLLGTLINIRRLVQKHLKVNLPFKNWQQSYLIMGGGGGPKSQMGFVFIIKNYDFYQNDTKKAFFLPIYSGGH